MIPELKLIHLLVHHVVLGVTSVLVLHRNVSLAKLGTIFTLAQLLSPMVHAMPKMCMVPIPTLCMLIILAPKTATPFNPSMVNILTLIII